MTEDDVPTPDEPDARDERGDREGGDPSGEDEAEVLGDAASVRGPEDPGEAPRD